MKIQLSPTSIELILSAAQYTDRKAGAAQSGLNPIYAHILLDLKPNGFLSVSSVNDGRFHSGVCRVEGDFEAGVAAIKADKFASLLECLPSGSSSSLAVSDTSAQLTCGRSRYKLSVVDPSAFPRMPKMESGCTEIDLPSGLLQQGLERVMKSMANNDARPFLEAVCIEVKQGEVTFVATDGHRLSLESFPYVTAITENTQVLIPRKRVADLLMVLRKSNTPVRFSFNAQAARVYSTDLKWIFQFSLVDMRYPDYNRVIPNTTTMPVLKLDRYEFISALERISHIANKSQSPSISNKSHSPSCVIHADGSDIRISAKGESEDTGEEQVSNRNNVVGVTSSFNINYLLDALRKLDDGVVDLCMSGTTPCHLSGESQKRAFHVVMPVRM